MVSPSLSTQNDAPDSPLLRVEGLRVSFPSDSGAAPAVDGVSFSVSRGRTLGVVGESGCGKSVTALTVLQLVPSPGYVEAGQVLFEGRDLLQLDEKAMCRIRGNRIGMIFQEPMTSLNPLATVEQQIAETLLLHRDFSRCEARAEVLRLLEAVGIPFPGQRARNYPHHLSGGMRQRVMIAMALACRPALLIADEPTTALDVTVQAQILALMQEIQESTGTAILLITHDLGVVAQNAHDVAVMYAGNIVESAPVRELFVRPRHPYTVGLLDSLPRIRRIQTGAPLKPIAGNVPEPGNWPTGCRFHPRCPHAREACKAMTPDMENCGEKHWTRCIFWREIYEKVAGTAQG